MRDLLLLPGWSFDARVWAPLLAALDGRFRVHHAPAACPPGALVCGWSLGALQALHLAAAQPDAVSRLILIAATPRFLAAGDWPGQPAEMLADLAAAVAADRGAALRRFAVLANQGDAQARALGRTMTTLHAAGTPDTAALLAGLDQLRDEDLRAAVPAITTPTLLLHGAHDALMPLAAARWLAATLPAARLAVLAGSGHAPLLGAPASCAELILEFAGA
jgi:pimeloyl-[acyl-carrier protein] methyl ester esterase